MTRGKFKFLKWLTIIIALIGIVLYSTIEKAEAGDNKPYKDYGKVIEYRIASSISIYIIDHCEYVVMRTGNGAGITHKANCKNINHDR